MKRSLPKSVDEYLAARPEAVRPKLQQVRAAIKRSVPQAEEGIGYRMPGYKLHGKPMLYFAGFKEHYSLFGASGTFLAALEDELRGYELRKGTVRFPLTKPVPVRLISRRNFARQRSPKRRINQWWPGINRGASRHSKRQGGRLCDAANGSYVPDQ